jgi:hypothetical protein
MRNLKNIANNGGIASTSKKRESRMGIHQVLGFFPERFRSQRYKMRSKKITTILIFFDVLEISFFFGTQKQMLVITISDYLEYDPEHNPSS